MGAVAARRRVAVVGGRGDLGPLTRLGEGVVIFGSVGDCGSGDVRRLVGAIRAGSFDIVFVLARWGSHSATSRIRNTCRNLKVRFVIWPSGLSSLAQELES